MGYSDDYNRKIILAATSNDEKEAIHLYCSDTNNDMIVVYDKNDLIEIMCGTHPVQFYFLGKFVITKCLNN